MDTLCMYFVSLAFGMITTIESADAIEGTAAYDIQAILTPMAERIRVLPLGYAEAAIEMGLFQNAANRSSLRPNAGAYKIIKAVH